MRPSTDNTPAAGSAAKAAMIFSACARSAADGVKAALIGADLVGVDGKLAGKAFACRGAGLVVQSGLVAEVGEYAVDRLHSGRDRAGEGQRAGHAVGEGEASVGVIFGGGAERGGEVFGAPAHGGQRRLDVAVAQQPEQACRGLGDDGVDREVAGGVGQFDDVARRSRPWAGRRPRNRPRRRLRGRACGGRCAVD